MAYYILSLVIYTVFVATFVFEIHAGVAVGALGGEDVIIEREKHPGPYWVSIALQAVGLIVVPILGAVYL